MTTGRINQVRTIGGAPQGPASRRAPRRFVGRHAASARSRRLRMPGRLSPCLGGACLRPARGPSCPCGVAPTGTRSPAPGLRRPQPRPGPGGFRRPGASPRASEERASGRPGGRAAHAGCPPRALVRQPPTCAALSLGPVQAASDARARLPAPRRSAPQAGLGAELPMRGGPLGRSLASPRPALPSASARSRRLQTPGRVSPRLGGACLRPARGPSCPCGVAPAGARSPAPGLRRPQPRPGPGGFRRPGASPRASEERASGRAGGRAAHAGWPPRALVTSPRPAPSSPGQTASPPPSGSHVRSAGASTRQAVAHGKDTSRLRGGHRSPHAPGPSRRNGAPAPGYGRPTAGRRPGLGSVGVRSWRPGRRQRPCHRALCVLTRRGCPILYVPAQCAPAKTEALLRARRSSPPVFGRGGETSSPPKMGGEERGLLLLPSRFREGRSVGRAGRRAAPGVATERGTLADGRGGGMHRNR